MQILQLQGEDKATSIILHQSSVPPQVEQANPRKQQELPMLPAKGAISYKEEILKCQQFLSVSIRSTYTYLIKWFVGLIRFFWYWKLPNKLPLELKDSSKLEKICNFPLIKSVNYKRLQMFKESWRS